MARCGSLSYTLRRTEKDSSDKPDIIINKGDVNDDMGLVFLGKRRREYGEVFNENMLHLLENFACPAENPDDPITEQLPDVNTSSVPNAFNNPLPGQLWYNKSAERLYYWGKDDLGYYTWIALSKEDDIAGNRGQLYHGEIIPKPVSHITGYEFEYDESSWNVSPAYHSDKIVDMTCETIYNSDGDVEVVMTYTPEGATEPIPGIVNYQIISIRDYNPDVEVPPVTLIGDTEVYGARVCNIGDGHGETILGYGAYQVQSGVGPYTFDVNNIAGDNIYVYTEDHNPTQLIVAWAFDAAECENIIETGTYAISVTDSRNDTFVLEVEVELRQDVLFGTTTMEPTTTLEPLEIIPLTGRFVESDIVYCEDEGGGYRGITAFYSLNVPYTSYAIAPIGNEHEDISYMASDNPGGTVTVLWNTIFTNCENSLRSQDYIIEFEDGVGRTISETIHISFEQVDGVEPPITAGDPTTTEPENTTMAPTTTEPNE